MTAAVKFAYRGALLPRRSSLGADDTLGERARVTLIGLGVCLKRDGGALSTDKRA